MAPLTDDELARVVKAARESLEALDVVPLHMRDDAFHEVILLARAAVELELARADAARFKADYFRCAEMAARMHAAAIGEVGSGPRRGVVEDVEDLRLERDMWREACAAALARLHDGEPPATVG